MSESYWGVQAPLRTFVFDAGLMSESRLPGKVAGRR